MIELEGAIEKSQRQERLFRENMTHLQSELDALVTENTTLKQKADQSGNTGVRGSRVVSGSSDMLTAANPSAMETAGLQRKVSAVILLIPLAIDSC